MSDTQVTNSAELSRFEIRVDDGALAGFTQYTERDGVRDFFHTEIGDEFEGHGIGSKLARGALDQTRAEGLKVTASCPFIKEWIDKHEEYHELLA